MARIPATILGLSAHYHDSAAALLIDGQVVAAAQEERFSRKKHDSGFPMQAANYCLKAADIPLSQVQYVAFYDKPMLKFERLLETYLAYAPRGFRSFRVAMPVWLKEKLFLKAELRKNLAKLEGTGVAKLPPLLFASHHQSHAASAFYPSSFEESAVLCLDGVGEWATTTAWQGNGSSLQPLWSLDFPHSLGLLYSAFTYHAGFKVNSGEYKLMGLAPYGEPRYVDDIYRHLLDLKPDGTFRLNMEYFDYCTGLTMTSRKFDLLFGSTPRIPESKLTQREMDLAASIQAVLEEIVMRLSRTLHRETDSQNLCLAGGVALNCVANGRLMREGPFENLWIQPAAGDAGGAIGAAYITWHDYLGYDRTPTVPDAMNGSFLGPSYSNEDAKCELDRLGAVYETLPDEELFDKLATLLRNGNVVGWFQGRMEFGPRALGGRSIVGDPRDPAMQSMMNQKIKYRESFRPFAPSVLAEYAGEWFDFDGDSPYMLLVAPLKENQLVSKQPGERNLVGIGRLKASRSTIPAVTHIDYSARLQTVRANTNPRFHALLRSFFRQTGCPVLVNTSFNVRGEPIVCSPEDAYRCFMRTRMDYLVIENAILTKSEQPQSVEETDWQNEFELD